MSFTYGKRVSCYILFVPAIDSSSTYVAGHSEDSHSQSQDNGDVTAYPLFMDQQLMQQLVNNKRGLIVWV